MADRYRYHGAPESRAFAPLPAGDYSFVVSSADPAYYKNNKWVLEVKLTIQPQGMSVWAHPWSGVDKNREDRDGIAEFLIAVNRLPALGEEPEWGRLIGARGKCRLKVEPDQNDIERNKVSFFHRPKQVGPTTEQPPPSYSEPEVKKAAKAAQAAAGGDDPGPDDLPFWYYCITSRTATPGEPTRAAPPPSTCPALSARQRSAAAPSSG